MEFNNGDHVYHQTYGAGTVTKGTKRPTRVWVKWNETGLTTCVNPVQVKHLVPINDFNWTDDYTYHRLMICDKHNVQFSTKNPYDRSIFIVKGVDCKCPLNSLMVLSKEKATGNDACTSN